MLAEQNPRPTVLRSIYRIRVNLLAIDPPIWRRLLVSSSTSLAEFHHILQITMGWSDAHLHQFIHAGNIYGIPAADNPTAILESKSVRLNKVLKREQDHLLYQYDFGDGWEHRVELEEILPFDIDQKLPRCIEGERACPPENVGGVPGYAYFLEAIEHPDHPEHDTVQEWMESRGNRYRHGTGTAG